MSAVTKVFMWVIILALVGALVYFIVLPGVNLWQIHDLIRDMEGEGEHESQFPRELTELPGEAGKALIEKGDPAVEHLIDLLTHREQRVREKAFYCLQKITRREEWDYYYDLNMPELQEEQRKIRLWWEKERKRRKSGAPPPKPDEEEYEEYEE